MNIHLVNGVYNSIYTKKLANFLVKHFPKEEHLFVLFGGLSSKHTNVVETGVNVFAIDSVRKFYKLLKMMNQTRRVFVHSLFSAKDILFLTANPKILKKTMWIIWGGDLYSYWVSAQHSFKEQIKEKMKAAIVRRVDGVACLLREDYEFLITKYRTSARYHYLFYPNPVDFGLLDNHSNECSNTAGLQTVLLGNSATWTNNHFDVLEAMSKVGKASFQILCPLSYGDPEYAKKVIEFGRKLFGDRFIPLTQFLSPEEYAKVLASVDVGIFNHNRQQGLGNILALLYLGKKVYIRDDVTPWKFFERYGIKVYNTKELISNPDSSIFDFDESIGRKNREIVAREFSEERAVELWKKVFYE